MPPFRNPFVKKPPVLNGATTAPDENARPSLAVDQASQRSSNNESRASSTISIKPKKEEPSEYKLSGTSFTPAPIQGGPALDRADPQKNIQWSMIVVSIYP